MQWRISVNEIYLYTIIKYQRIHINHDAYYEFKIHFYLTLIPQNVCFSSFWLPKVVPKWLRIWKHTTYYILLDFSCILKISFLCSKKSVASFGFFIVVVNIQATVALRVIYFITCNQYNNYITQPPFGLKDYVYFYTYNLSVEVI